MVLGSIYYPDLECNYQYLVTVESYLELFHSGVTVYRIAWLVTYPATFPTILYILLLYQS